MTERHRVAYRLRTAAEGPDGIEQCVMLGKHAHSRSKCIGHIIYLGSFGEHWSYAVLGNAPLSAAEGRPILQCMDRLIDW